MEARDVARIVVVGGEVLAGRVADANGPWIARFLKGRGFVTAASIVVPDDVEAAAGAIRDALEDARLVVVAGGLGATSDDVTREAVARALGVRTAPHAEALRMVEAAFRRRGRPLPTAARRMGELPQGAAPLANPVGLAPGFRIEREGRLLVVLPGVPEECRAVLSACAEVPRGTSTSSETTLRLVGVTETRAEEEVGGLLRVAGLSYGLYPRDGELDLVVAGDVVAGDADRVEDALRRVEAILAEYIVGRNGATLEGRLVERLTERGETLALAESSTGGLVAERIVSVPGASRVFLGGVVAYADEAKREFLGVSEDTLVRFGAVSRETAREMALGARARFRADYGIATTGVAGPEGGTPEKPVGLHFLALATPEGVAVEERRYAGTRGANRRRAATDALNLLRRYLLERAGRG